METREKTDEEKRKEERLSESALQTLGAYFPDPAVKARLGGNFKEMIFHDWASPNARAGVMEAMEGAKTAHELGFGKQVKHQLLKAEDRFLFDVSNKAVALARRAGCDLRPLAKLSKEPGKSFEIRGLPIRGRNVRWRFVDIESYENPIPTDVLLNAKTLRNVGVEWDRVFVAEPVIEVPVYFASSVAGNDPLLAASRGRWLWEIGRWL